MRLLDARNMKLVERYGKDVPPYAILSHTWDEDEVLFQDMQHPDALKKKGYTKIKYCCDQALSENIHYIWADTCCIDKSSSAELSEAINSMFKWYASAVVCYAYLPDISDWDRIILDFWTHSRWFTRGWTLQELIAPKHLVFYSSNWNKLGTRNELASVIEGRLSISRDALTGDFERLKKFSIAQKMSWASYRETTREEDIAYCLLGVFNVSMPLLYGEGMKAFIRLQEEIMKDSDDQSIFGWDLYWGQDARLGPLAPSPRTFMNSHDILPVRSWEASKPYSMTNSGLRITARVVKISEREERSVRVISKFEPVETDSALMLVLDSYRVGNPERVLGFRVCQLFQGGDQYARLPGMLTIESSDLIDSYEPNTVYIRKEIMEPDGIHTPTAGNPLKFKVVLRRRMWDVPTLK